MRLVAAAPGMFHLIVEQVHGVMAVETVVRTTVTVYTLIQPTPLRPRVAVVGMGLRVDQIIGATFLRIVAKDLVMEVTSRYVEADT